VHNHFIFWIVFAVIIITLFYIDLYVTDHRKGKIGIKSSLKWSGIWILSALVFNLIIFLFLEDGKTKAIEFLTGYLIEKSLSVDNLFIFLMIFSVMGISEEKQPHVLKWGIISAIVLRIIFIMIGVTIISLFHPVIYIFGLILFYAAYKMAFAQETTIDYKNNWLIKIASRYLNITTDYKGARFFVRQKNKILVTQIFLTLLLIESADIVFAIDSIPAVIAITRDPFIIITSNIFAILGLRALYFALAGIIELFIYLKYGVATILAYVGIKMIISDFYKIPTIVSLGVILLCIVIPIAISLFSDRKKKANS
jgi:tellurite resistance protein TerC